MSSYGRTQQVYSPKLVEWIELQYGPNKRYRSARKLSMAARLNYNAVNSIISRGRAQPETLMRLAEATDTSIRYLFVLAGWLPPEEDMLPPLEEEAITLYRKLPEDRREVINKLTHTLLELGELGNKLGGFKFRINII